MPKHMSLLFEAFISLLGVVSLVFGVFLFSVPAGFIATGLILLTAGYVARALEVSNGDS